MEERLKWNQIVSKYPDRWVALSNCEMEGDRVVSAIVEIACREADRYDNTIALKNKGIKFRWRRTTFLEGANVLCRM